MVTERKLFASSSRTGLISPYQNIFDSKAGSEGLQIDATLPTWRNRTRGGKHGEVALFPGLIGCPRVL